MNKKTKMIVFGLVALAVVAFFIIPAISNFLGKDEIEASGTIQAREIIITSQVSGVVKDINKDEGDSVTENLLLLEIDDLDLQFEKQSENFKLAEI